jgi:hypothetical protein
MLSILKTSETIQVSLPLSFSRLVSVPLTTFFYTAVDISDGSRARHDTKAGAIVDARTAAVIIIIKLVSHVDIKLSDWL